MARAKTPTGKSSTAKAGAAKTAAAKAVSTRTATAASAAAIGKKAPPFEAPATGEQTIRLADLKGKKVVLYFYPKDSTPGCTKEGCDFRDNMNRLRRAGAVVLGVSRDSVASHEKFKKAQGFNFDLLSDKDEALCSAYGVMKDKSMYGKTVRGVERSTFLIDEDGILRKEWRGVKVDGHVDEVLGALKEL